MALAPELILEYRGQKNPVFIAYFMEYFLSIHYKISDLRSWNFGCAVVSKFKVTASQAHTVNVTTVDSCHG